jgi:hypothetical protein
MPANYTLIEKITVGAAGASSITFSSIPQTGYTDLVVKMSGRTNRTDVDSVTMTFNGSSTGITWRTLFGDGSAVTSGTAQRFWVNSTTQTANTFGNAEVYIPNYTSANYKSTSIDTVTENNATGAYAEILTQLWSNTAAITSIEFAPQFGTGWLQYSTFYLYGVAKLGTTPAIVPYATGGDTIMTDGTYWYHTFISSGTFTPAKALSCDYLVVAGGGGGGTGILGNDVGGGDGAGGLRSTVTATGGGGSLETALSLATGTGYTVTIGAGGAANTLGSNSVFSTITSTGGGNGAGNLSTNNGAAGGSGGAGRGASTGVGSIAGAGTANQGYAGGNGSSSSQSYGGGGGGGANAIGGSGSGTNGGNGGNGVATSITGSSVTYAGGGGGGTGAYSTAGPAGTGGTGGGGAGGQSATAGTAGTPNTGGGGGGGGSSGGGNGTGGTGGSGIVIVRYAV